MKAKWIPLEGVDFSDRRSVLLKGPAGVVVAYQNGYEWIPDRVECTYDMASCVINIGEPTHYMELPR